MRIRDITIEDVAARKNWRLRTDSEHEILPDMEIDECASLLDDETVVYSALCVTSTSRVRPLLLIREVGTYEWWGDMCEYINGQWREVQQTDDVEWHTAESYVAAPLGNDVSFMEEHAAQRAGFDRWRHGLGSTRAK